MDSWLSLLYLGHKMQQRGFPLSFCEAMGQVAIERSFSSIDAGKSCNKQGGKARKILENGSPPPLTISEAILLLRLKEEEAVSREERVRLALDRTLNQTERKREGEATKRGRLVHKIGLNL